MNPTQTTVILSNPAALPTEPSEALQRVSSSDIANMLRIKKTQALVTQLAGYVAELEALQKEAERIIRNSYLEIEDQLLGFVNNTRAVKMLGIEIHAKPTIINVQLPSGRLWVNADVVSSPGPAIDIAAYYLPGKSNYDQPLQHTNKIDNALFEVLWNNRSYAAGVKETSEADISTTIIFGRIEVQIPCKHMPEWNPLENIDMEKYAAIHALYLQVKDQINKLEKPGVIEAAMTEHILRNAQIDVDALLSSL